MQDRNEALKKRWLEALRMEAGDGLLRYEEMLLLAEEKSRQVYWMLGKRLTPH
ncbi:hypothetical protein HCH_00514 [Hahella chejuensis KCTC 2396]|uniref:Uncharacterized protein n=1 Tax=Hahella chejuensis (strain KCTC 2396) TaxID=349521 RepID=Q2SPK4_HAHCH|nr:hypothetical protein [Hahella chejuensis]ABC27420.1 hypothetical protein HCH_00514 [Hahella chejuensis KCTC 2396]